MLKHNYLQKDYTTNGVENQLKIPFEIELKIEKSDPVMLLSQYVEEMDLTDLYSTYERIRENQATPRQLLKILLYGYMNREYSSRAIETRCKRDINFMYLLEDNPAPDHSTIARFRSLHFSLCAEKLLAQMSEFLFEIGEISGKNLFVDGTKIESCANKYTFVWKKAVTKNLARLLENIAALVQSCEEEYGIKIIYGNEVHLKHVKRLRKKLYGIKKQEKVVFVHGIGKRKHPVQKSIELLEKYMDKLKEYTQKLYKCGKRNSYSKTDEDATFMRLKEDAMLNGQLKPAYNLQHGVDSEYIVWLTIGAQPTDTTTLIPFIKTMEEHLSFKYQKIIADAGYESEENYLFLEKNNQLSFIKPANYEISKTRKYRNDISRVENMEYIEDSDCYICKNQRILSKQYVRNSKTKTGYKREFTIYKCEDCSSCPFKRDCIKGNNCKIPFEERNKVLQVSKKFMKCREEDLERIISEEGCQLRMNRSIQVEGSFGNIKQDMGFRRYLSRGKQNVTAESILLAMAHNINKLHRKIQSDRMGNYLFDLKTTA